ncbi:MAG: hypothetical protein Q7S77_01685, partial [Candidatus Staskawiczbacteria bacterium]|nr:hypothetical protein [Candidatus Staskawiczbacteria bacterium]
FLVVFYFIIPGFCFATELNVNYPVLSTGAGINFQTPIQEYLKYIFDFAIFLGYFTAFLSLVFAGVLYLLSPAMPNALSIAKDRVTGVISGIIILTTVYLIITTINPALSIFKTTPLKDLPPPSNTTQRQTGVYLYNETNCPAFKNNLPNHSFFSTNSSPDLGTVSKQMQSVEIVHNWGNDTHYIAILYENPKLWGKCKYINPNTSCENIDPFASSISIYQYNYYPNSGSVIFYRKPFFDSGGGSYQIPGPSTKNIYIQELKKLTFNNVPENEKECIEWDKKGTCIKRKPQDLSGENISSIKIDGNYLVLLVYFDKKKPDPDDGPWSFCQAFGTFDDKDKNGPREIKWENIRNLNSGDLPNYVIIFPVEDKKN